MQDFSNDQLVISKTGENNSIISLDPLPSITTNASNVRFFRNTTSTSVNTGLFIFTPDNGVTGVSFSVLPNGTQASTSSTTGNVRNVGGYYAGDNSFFDGTLTIDNTGTEALLVRKDADGGDVFVVDTTNSTVSINAVDITPSVGELPETSFSAANNQAAAANVTGFAFAEATTRSFRAIVSVSIDATADLYEQFELRGLQKATGTWVLSANSIGDVSNVTFSITSSGGNGQIQYTSGNEAGFVSNTIKFLCSEVTVIS